MTEVPPERAQALVEYIAHLSVEDFEAVVMHDLPALGFIPPGACPCCPWLAQCVCSEILLKA